MTDPWGLSGGGGGRDGTWDPGSTPTPAVPPEEEMATAGAALCSAGPSRQFLTYEEAATAGAELCSARPSQQFLTYEEAATAGAELCSTGPSRQFLTYEEAATAGAKLCRRRAVAAVSDL